MKTSNVKLGILCGTIAAALNVNPTFAAPEATGAEKAQPPAAEAKPSEKELGARWSDRIFDEFQAMQQRMDRLFSEATREIEHPAGWFGDTDFTASVKVSEDDGNYVVHVSLPDRDLNNVEAKVEANSTLRITAKEEKKERTTSRSKEKKDAIANYELGRYEQLLTLPGPVDASKMKIDRSGSSVTIALPKSEHAGTPSGKS